MSAHESLECRACDGAGRFRVGGHTHAGESEQAIDCLRCEGTGVEPCMLCGYAPADRIVDDGLPVCSACAEPAGPTVHDTLPAPAPLQDVMLIEDVRPWLTPRQTIAIARKAGER